MPVSAALPASAAAVAMSGGVDSSVAAYLMKEAGYNCVGVTMKLLSGYDGFADDGSAGDAGDVALRLGIPHHVLDMAEDFDREVVRGFVEAYERGDTPNPCVECNRRVKFGKLRERAAALGCGLIATGHYARAERGPDGRVSLKKALDETKDQSYFLCTLTQEQLSNALFPLGALTKKEVREIAMEQGFLNAQKRESQDVCFVTGGDYAGFIERYRGRRCEPGSFVDPAGGVLGRHGGAIRYTLGQRRGLGVSAPQRLYVCGKNMGDNTVVLGSEDLLYSKVLFADNLNLISGALPRRAQVRTAYRRAPRPASVELVGGDTIRIEFDEPQKSTAPGQTVALYDGDAVLCSSRARGPGPVSPSGG